MINLSIKTLCYNSDYLYAGSEGYSVWKRPLLDIIGIRKISSSIPKNFSLSQNYPNPFNPSTKIQFAIPKAGIVDLKVYDVLGQEVKSLVREFKQSGVYSVEFDGTNFSSGVYFYKIEAGTFSETKRMVLVK